MTGKFQSILLGGLIVGLLGSLFGLAQFGVQSQVLGWLACCVVPTTGAFVSTWHYASTNAITIPQGQGATIGLAACLLGYAISAVLSVLISLTGLIPNPFDAEAVMQLTRERMMQSGSSAEQIDKATEFVGHYFYLFNIIAVIAYGLLGAVAGAIGANLFKRGSAQPE